MFEMIASLVILGVCLLLFATEKLPCATTALLGTLAVVLCGICTPAEAAAGFTSDVVFIVFGMDIVGTAIFTSGLAQVIEQRVVRQAQSREAMLLNIGIPVTAVLSMFLSNMAVTIMMLTVCASIASRSGSVKLANLALPIAYAAVLGGGITLVGSTPQLLASGLLEELAGQGFHMFSLTGVAAPIAVVVLLLVRFVQYPRWRNRWESPAGASRETEPEALSADPRQVRRMLMVLAGLVLLFVTNWIPPGVAAILGAMICIVWGLTTQKEAFARMNWNVLIWLGASTGIAKGLSASGATDLIAQTFLRLVDVERFPILFFASCVLVSLVLSNFIANTTAVAILLPMILPAVLSAGLNPAPFAVGITLGASFAVATPLANGFIGYTLSAGYRFKEIVRYGWLLSALIWLLICGLCCLCYPLALPR